MENSKVVLLSGSDGLIGTALIPLLLNSGYRVHALSRRKNRQLENTAHQDPALTYFYWDVDKGVIDPACLIGVEAIVHLAGENIGSRRWTSSRKEKILSSRVDSISLIYELILKEKYTQVKTVVSASATGYYADSSRDGILVEGSPASADFLGRVCVTWESAVEEGIQRMGLRTVCYRTGVVLAVHGGIYTLLKPMVSKGLGLVLGSGRQWMPWIHIEDACQAYLHAIEHDNMSGAYNLVAPDQVRFGEFMRVFAEKFKKSIWLPRVPSVFLRVGMGKMSALLLGSARVSSSKLQQTGFDYKYGLLREAFAGLDAST